MSRSLTDAAHCFSLSWIGGHDGCDIHESEITMKLNIDVSGVQFFCTRGAEARTDRETGVPRLDRESGLPLWQVQVAALDATGGEVLAVTVAGEPSVAVGQMVTIERLVAIPWSQGDRSGVAYRAASITSSGTPMTTSASTPSGSERPTAGSKSA